jgi:3-dehydroquinate synthase
MAMAGAISVRRGLLDQDGHQRLIELLKRFRLPTSLDSLGLDPQVLLQTMHKDKKREGDRIHLVLLHGLGRAVVETTSVEALRKALES